ncbi:MAG: hypothetical protein OXH79_01570 [Boseongicola sp.]|nr:hypothetical protein [Boseongicola sp.]
MRPAELPARHRTALAEGTATHLLPDASRPGLPSAGDDALLEDLVNHASRLVERYECEYVAMHCMPATISHYRFVLRKHLVPACNVETDVQQVRIVIEGLAGHVPTALIALDLDDALTICDKLNRRLGFTSRQWTVLAAQSLRAETPEPGDPAAH